MGGETIEVLADDYEEMQCMVEQNIANHFYNTGQPKITVIMESPLYPIMKLLGMKTVRYTVKDALEVIRWPLKM